MRCSLYYALYVCPKATQRYVQRHVRPHVFKPSSEELKSVAENLLEMIFGQHNQGMVTNRTALRVGLAEAVKDFWVGFEISKCSDTCFRIGLPGVQAPVLRGNLTMPFEAGAYPTCRTIVKPVSVYF
jgi:hypothetical protein